MVYDCFAFFNELELLELRLNTLSSVVDKFVLMEATRTFQKQPKPLYYQENKHLFKAFEDKIIHVVVDRFPGFFHKFRTPTAWDYDNYQKNQLARGLAGCKPEDVIIVSDLDEIPSPESIRLYKDTPGAKVFEQKLYYYFLNCRCTHYDVPETAIAQRNLAEGAVWRGPVMLFFKDFTTVRKVRKIRDQEGDGITVIHNGGWHFSYMGGIEKIIRKIESLAHPEFNTASFKDPQRIREIVARGEDLFGRGNRYAVVPLDETFPEYILQNREKFAQFVQ